MGAGVWSAQRLLVVVRVMDPGPPRDAAPCHLARLTFLFQKWENAPCFQSHPLQTDDKT